MSRDSSRKRLEAATPGPWRNEKKPGEWSYYDDRAPVDHEGCEDWPWHRKEDMDFAYAARDDIPALLAVADAATALVYSVSGTFPQDEWDALVDALEALEALP